jgi:shikimate kinase
MSGSLVLIGLSGSGKSTVGKYIAGRLALPLLDTDRMIEEEHSMTVAEIFARSGEPYFRALEEQAVARACAQTAIVSLGGGAVLAPSNRRAMRRGNLVVWLDLPTGLLTSRLAAHATTEQRPLLAGDVERRLLDLRAARRSLYAQAAHIRVSGKAPDGVGSHAIAARLTGVFTAWRSGRLGI